MPKEHKIFGLPKNVFFLGLTSFFNDFSSEMVLSVFPAFFTSVLKTGAASLGLVEGVADAMANFVKVYSGALSDRLQKRRFLVIAGYTLSTMTRPFYLFVSQVFGAFSLRVLDRVGKGLRDAPRDAIISLSVRKEELGRSFGYHRAMDTLGGILGPLAAFGILYYFPLQFSAVFVSAFFVGLLALLTLFFIKDVIRVRNEVGGRLFASFADLSSQFKLFLLAVFLLSLGSLPIAVLLLSTQSIGLLIATIPLFYMLYNMSYAAFSITAGETSDKAGGTRVLLVGYVLLLVSYVLFSFATSAIMLAVGFIVLGIFSALTDGVLRAKAARLTDERVRGGAFGLLNAATGIGALLAGILGGLVWEFYGPSTAYVLASVCVVAGMFLLFGARTNR